MMQAFNFISLVPLILIILGIGLVIYGVSLYFRNSQNDSIDRESKGFILLGPIPIVWGYGWRGWTVAIILGLVLFFLLLW